MKAMNSEAKQISELVKRVPIKIKTWSISTYMMVVPLNNLQVILEMEFMHTVKFLPMSFLNSLCLMGGNNLYVVLIS